jgi:hypothetical protein
VRKNLCFLTLLAALFLTTPSNAASLRIEEFTKEESGLTGACGGWTLSKLKNSNKILFVTTSMGPQTTIIKVNGKIIRLNLINRKESKKTEFIQYGNKKEGIELNLEIKNGVWEGNGILTIIKKGKKLKINGFTHLGNVC